MTVLVKQTGLWPERCAMVVYATYLLTTTSLLYDTVLVYAS